MRITRSKDSEENDRLVYDFLENLNLDMKRNFR
jgi:hypothetical protein